MRLRRGSSVERGQPGRTPQAETETTTRSHRRSAATRSEERDRVRRRHLGDKLLHDVREDREHGDARVPDLALLQAEELLRAGLGDARRAVVARDPVVAAGLLDAKPLRFDEGDQEGEGNDGTRDRRLLEAAVDQARGKAARLGDEVGQVEARSKVGVQLLLERPGDGRQHGEAAVLELGVAVVAEDERRRARLVRRRPEVEVEVGEAEGIEASVAREAGAADLGGLERAWVLKLRLRRHGREKGHVRVGHGEGDRERHGCACAFWGRSA
mmetsp:Transcript_4462/g.7374  ORF Transcript_4462/g.7374 Transcript_4462/m.7374 type:complete len:270 (+) Transcript_4462:266-1075(+)